VSYFLGEKQIHQSNFAGTRKHHHFRLTVTYTIKLEIIDCLFKDSYNDGEHFGSHAIA
jgi:hypothetical protein